MSIAAVARRGNFSLGSRVVCAGGGARERRGRSGYCGSGSPSALYRAETCGQDARAPRPRLRRGWGVASLRGRPCGVSVCGRGRPRSQAVVGVSPVCGPAFGRVGGLGVLDGSITVRRTRFYAAIAACANVRAGTPAQPGSSRLPCRRRAFGKRAGRMPAVPGPAFGGVGGGGRGYSAVSMTAMARSSISRRIWVSSARSSSRISRGSRCSVFVRVAGRWRGALRL